jgi:hypothetical protein
VIIYEGEEVSFAAGHDRTVQCVADPQFVGPVGFEPAEHLHLREVRRRRRVQVESFEVALQGAFRRRPARPRAQNPRHLRRGAGQVLPFEPGGHVEDLGGGAGVHLRRTRDEAGEPLSAPPSAPPVDRLPRHGGLLSERAVVFTFGDRAYQRAPLLGRQAHVDDVLDEPVAKQRDLASSLGPNPNLIISGSQCHSPQNGWVICPR